MRWRYLLMVVALLSFLAGITVVRAETSCDGKNDQDLIDCLSIQINELNDSLEKSRAATAPLEVEINKLSIRIKSIQGQINTATIKLKQTEAGIKERSEKVSTQYLVLAVKIRGMYIRIRSEPLWVSLLSSTSMGEARRELAYRQESNDNDKQLIVSLIQEIGQLEEDKKSLEKQKEQLAKLQTELDKQNTFFQGEVKKAKAYQTDLTGKIAALTELQARIKAEKEGTFSTTVGDVPLADDPASRPDYNPGFSPAFASFSFGAPHFKGMSQYGAYGRAKSGQNAEEILKAYYGGIEIKKDYDPGKQISVQGYGRMDIETYTKRIYEVPNSWGDSGGFEALKAQAIAARSYALAWTNEGSGGAICTDQGCQVYKNSNKGGKWEEAVNATRGWVLVKDGKIIKPWYASTSGGYQESYDALSHRKDGSSYQTPSFWDTKNGRGGWTSSAYEKIGESPWFYKAWYKSRGGDSCGRSHPWLTAEQMADILNAWVVRYKSGKEDRLVPLEGCGGGNPYSISELREKAKGLGGGYERVIGVSVSYSDGGYTSNVHFDTDKGGVDIKGSEFKEAFNIRAPGWVSLKSGLFNIEKK
ncbi:MAG: Stage II sporulation protein [Candidatus Collierbacteria bacterium GW2011_GWC2_43_12]|uniref:Stage II sporulation protein n=1 Tax=Candidatus Collierbacteria bacterium GW2011_GWC2_43_12 TaxID=1618390 RepID=A0A0G1D642_9BACT|nr:MAG: Stage II sporulation protein [Candidatus Collierbacteria bacterium GW2011_GWC2_43_12]